MGAVIGAEDVVEVRGEVGEIVAGGGDAGVVPMMKLRRAEEVTERAEGEPDVGVDQDGP